MRVTIIADASFCHDTRASGYGYWAVSARKKVSGAGNFKDRPPDANAAEMAALLRGVFYAVQTGCAARGDVLLLQTDSMHTINTYQGRRAPSPGAEARLVESMINIATKYALSLDYRHVKGHTQRWEARYWCNRFCDVAARRAMYCERGQIRKAEREAALAAERVGNVTDAA